MVSSYYLVAPATYGEPIQKRSMLLWMLKNGKIGFINEQLSSLEKERGWVIPVDESLLEEMTYLVEFPTAFSVN